MRIWTLKEAFVKCRGMGINASPGLRGFSVGERQSPPGGKHLTAVQPQDRNR